MDEEEAEMSDEEAEEEDEDMGEEDEEEEEDAPASSLAGHKKELEALKARDPKFYAYLQKNSANLLELEDDEEEEGEEDGGQEAEEAVEGMAGGEEEEGGPAAAPTSAEREPTLVTPALARSIFDAAFPSGTSSAALPSYRALGKALSMFRAAVYLGESPDVLARLGLGAAQPVKGRVGAGGKTGKDARGEDRTHAAERDAHRAPVLLRYKISSPSVFMLVVTQVLQRAAGAFSRHLGSSSKVQQGGASGGAGGSAPAPRVPLPSYSGWSKVELPSRALLKCTLQLLAQSSDPSLQLFILRSLRAYLPYLQAQGSLTRKAAGALTRLWAEEEAEGVKTEAFLRLRQMAVVLPSPALELVLKGLYHAFARAAKGGHSEASAPGLLLMAGCITEAYGLEEAAAYTHAFVYIRDLAVHLRSALTTRSKEAVSAVLSWRFLSCLRVWTGVIAAHGAEPGKQLFQLAYPLTQVILGAVKLQPSPRYFPFALHACALLCELAWATGTYIPIAPLLWDILRSPALAKKPKEAVGGGGAGGPTPLSLMVRAGVATVASKSWQDAVVGRALDLLLDAMKASFASPAFPEIAAPVCIQLRHFAKETRVAGWRSRARALVDAFTGQAAVVSARRGALAAAPGDKGALAAFMAAEGAKYRGERAAAKAAAAAAAMAEARAGAEAAKARAREEEEARARGKGRGKGRRGGREEDSDSDEEEEEGESGQDDEEEDSENDSESEEEEEQEEVEPAPKPKPSSHRGTTPHHAAKPLSAKLARGGRGLPGDVVEDFDASDLLGDE